MIFRNGSKKDPESIGLLNRIVPGHTRTLGTPALHLDSTNSLHNGIPTASGATHPAILEVGLISRASHRVPL